MATGSVGIRNASLSRRRRLAGRPGAGDRAQGRPDRFLVLVPTIVRKAFVGQRACQRALHSPRKADECRASRQQSRSPRRTARPARRFRDALAGARCDRARRGARRWRGRGQARPKRCRRCADRDRRPGAQLCFARRPEADRRPRPFPASIRAAVMRSTSAPRPAASRRCCWSAAPPTSPPSMSGTASSTPALAGDPRVTPDRRPQRARPRRRASRRRTARLSSSAMSASSR